MTKQVTGGLRDSDGGESQTTGTKERRWRVRGHKRRKRGQEEVQVQEGGVPSKGTTGTWCLYRRKYWSINRQVCGWVGWQLGTQVGRLKGRQVDGQIQSVTRGFFVLYIKYKIRIYFHNSGMCLYTYSSGFQIFVRHFYKTLLDKVQCFTLDSKLSCLRFGKKTSYILHSKDSDNSGMYIYMCVWMHIFNIICRSIQRNIM